MPAPAVFISSTCNDLGQLRKDLGSFLLEIGYKPLISESPSFSVDPFSTAVDNCFQIIDNEADIFILIIGNRYGSKSETGKSITHLEYSRAKSKGLPIYIFIKKDIETVFYCWQKNPTGDYSHMVDDPKLFEFIAEVLESNKWKLNFESAQEIITQLKTQLAHLFFDSLKAKQRIASFQNPTFLKLEGNAARIATEQADAWEYFLFSEILNSGINNVIDLRRDLEYKITTQKILHFESKRELLSWIISEIQTVLQATANCDTLINQLFREATGEPGQAGDIDLIRYTAERLVDVYRSMLEWTIRARLMVVPEDCQAAALHASRFYEDMIAQIENLNTKFRQGVLEALEELNTKGGPIKIKIDCTFHATGTEEFTSELKKWLTDSENP